MNYLLRTTGILLASLLVLAPGASAAGPSLDLAANANVRADTSFATDAAASALADVEARADDARAQLEAQAAELQAKATATAQTAAGAAEAQADASVEASASIGARAMGAIQDAFAAIAEFAGSLFVGAQADVSAKVE